MRSGPIRHYRTHPSRRPTSEHPKAQRTVEGRTYSLCCAVLCCAVICCPVCYAVLSYAALRCADACALIRSVSQAHHHVVLHDDIGVRTRRLRLAAHPILMRLRVAVAIVVVCFFRRLCRCCAIESLRRRGARYCRCCLQYDANHFMSDFRRLARRITVRPLAHTHTRAHAFGSFAAVHQPRIY